MTIERIQEAIRAGWSDDQRKQIADELAAMERVVEDARICPKGIGSVNGRVTVSADKVKRLNHALDALDNYRNTRKGEGV